MSQMPSKSIPKLFVRFRFMLLTSLCEKRDSHYRRRGMPQCPTALPETYECSPVRSPRIGQDLRLMDVSSFLHYLLPLSRDCGNVGLHCCIKPFQGRYRVLRP